jgi:hypothetical protein
MDGNTGDINAMWKYINKLEYIVLQSVKERIAYKKQVKEKLKK